MNDLDDNGWGHIHHAADRGFIKSIERFVSADPDQLELETGDDLHSTPFLLAVSCGNKDSVECLLGLGAKTNAINTQNHGAIEICALKHFIELLEYFATYNDEKLPVWKNLLKFLSSDDENEAEASGKCLRTLTQGSQAGGLNPNWEKVHSAGGVPLLVKVVKSTAISDESKIPTFHTILNMIEREEVKEQLVSSGGIPVFIKHLKSPHLYAVQLSAQILKELAKVKEYADQAAQNGAVPALLNVIKTIKNEEVLVESVAAIGNIAGADETHQNAFGTTPDAIKSIVALLESCTVDPLWLAITKTVRQISQGNSQNQKIFVDDGAGTPIVLLIRGRNRDVQISAVEAIHTLASDNLYTQKALLDKSAERYLMQLITKNRSEVLLEKTSGALWALAGESFDTKKAMASGMGVPLLIEFLNSIPEKLHYIGSEGLGVLAQGPKNSQVVIGQASGILPLVRHLRSDKEHIVLSVIQTLRHLTVGVGYVPNIKNQNAISHARGIRYLVALMVHSRNELIQVEAALSLAAVSLGNPDISAEIHRNIDFSFVRILKMMYSIDENVRLLAGGALATFAFNNIAGQREIGEQGGVRFNCLVPFLQSEDEYFRCNAAFQVVVLARIIPDEEQANSSAVGIKLLSDLLQDSQSATILALASDCIARLAHTRAGVPNAIIAIQTVDHLCRLLVSQAEQVRGSAAIALGYLSYNHTGERQLLGRCRTYPYLMKVIRCYTKNGKLSNSFEEGWQHYKRVGLPPVEEGRVSLVSPRQDQYKEPVVRPDTMVSVEDPEKASNRRSSESNLHLLEDGNLTARSSGSSRTSRLTNHVSVLSMQHSNPPMSGSQLSVNLVGSEPSMIAAVVAEDS